MKTVSCRICLEEYSLEDTDDNVFKKELIMKELVSPCKCSGSSKYVHIKCLDTWRKNNLIHYLKCNTCNDLYNIFFDERYFKKLFKLSISTLIITFFLAYIPYYYKFFWLGSGYYFVNQFKTLPNQAVDFNFSFNNIINSGYILNGYFESSKLIPSSGKFKLITNFSLLFLVYNKYVNLTKFLHKYILKTSSITFYIKCYINMLIFILKYLIQNNIGDMVSLFLYKDYYINYNIDENDEERVEDRQINFINNVFNTLNNVLNNE